MSWFDWVLISYLSLNILTAIRNIGREQKPTTPGVAIGVTILCGLLIAGVVAYG